MTPATWFTAFSIGELAKHLLVVRARESVKFVDNQRDRLASHLRQECLGRDQRPAPRQFLQAAAKCQEAAMLLCDRDTRCPLP